MSFFYLISSNIQVIHYIKFNFFSVFFSKHKNKMSSKNKILFLILINAISLALSQVSTIRTTTTTRTIRTTTTKTTTTKTTTTLTTSQWIYDYYYDYSLTQGCFSNYFRNYLTVNSSATINPNSPDFKNYFIPLKYNF